MLTRQRGAADISADAAIAELVTPNIRTPLYKRFLSGGAVFRPCEELIRLDGADVLTRNIYSGAEIRIENVEVLVNWRGNHVTDDLLGAIQAHSAPVKVIGDCRAPRQLHTAIAEGALAARSI